MQLDKICLYCFTGIKRKTMIKTHLTPKEQNISITVPQDYVGKEIEVLVYAVDEFVQESIETQPNNAARFKSIFSKEEGIKFNKYLEQARNEWERDF
jgi:hypothetical protein